MEKENVIEKSDEVLENEKLEKVKVKQEKIKATVVSINSGFIFLSYWLPDGIEYGTRIPLEPKHKNLKYGDTLFL